MQVSPKLGNTLINIQGDNPAEFEEHFGWFTENAQAVAEGVAAMEAAYNVVSGGLTAPPQQQQRPQGGPPPQAAPPGAAGPSCQHGAWTYSEGVGRTSGKAYKAWDCPAKGSPIACNPDRKFVR